MQMGVAEQVLSVLLVPGMFTTSYPIQAVRVNSDNVMEAVYDDYDIKPTMYPSLQHLVAYMRVVMQIGQPTVGTLLDISLPVGYQNPLQEACCSRQVYLFYSMLADVHVFVYTCCQSDHCKQTPDQEFW